MNKGSRLSDQGRRDRDLFHPQPPLPVPVFHADAIGAVEPLDGAALVRNRPRGTGGEEIIQKSRRFRQRRLERRGEGMQVFWPAGVEKPQLRAATVAETLFGGADGAIVHLRLVAGNVFISLDFQGLGEAEQENAKPPGPGRLAADRARTAGIRVRGVGLHRKSDGATVTRTFEQHGSNPPDYASILACFLCLAYDNTPQGEGPGRRD